MKTAGELHAEAQHLRDIARGVSAREVLEKIEEMIAELEARARELED
jgi:methionine aminopeptidase